MTETDIAKLVTEWLDDVALEAGNADQMPNSLKKMQQYIDALEGKPDKFLFDAITASNTWIEQKLANKKLTDVHSMHLDIIHKTFVAQTYSWLQIKLADAKLRRRYEIECDTDIDALQASIASSYDGLFDTPFVPIKQRKYILGKRGKFIKNRNRKGHVPQRRLTREQWIAEEYNMTNDVKSIEEEIERLTKKRDHLVGIEAAKEKVDAFIKDTGYTFDELYGETKKAKSTKPRKPSAPPMYQDPQDKRRKWAGPPKDKPQWILEVEQTGGDIEDYRVK